MKVPLRPLALVLLVSLAVVPGAVSQTIEGTQASAMFGYAVATGDLDGDGADDMAVGAPGWDAGSSDRGAVFIFIGPLSGDLDAADADSVWYGEAAGDGAGWSLAAGDLNGDGFDDLAVGSPESDASYPDAGQVHIVMGRRTFPVSATLSSANASYLGLDNGDRVGTSLSSGDVNGDGLDDLVIASPHVDTNVVDAGSIYIVFGKASGWNMDTRVNNANSHYRGSTAGHGIGFNVSCGDVNGDGRSDILIGAPWKNVYLDLEGAVYVCYGRAGPWPKFSDRREVKALNASFRGAVAGALLGWSVSAGIDVDGDGIGDIIMGAPGGDGRAYVMSGAIQWGTDVPATTDANRTIASGGAGDSCGRSVAAILFERSLSGGIVVGAPGADGGRGAYSVLDPWRKGNFSDGWVENGSHNSSLGHAIASGDMDGDGLHDVIVTAPWANTTVFQGGAVSVSPREANVAPSLSSVRFDQNGSVRPDFFLMRFANVSIVATGSGGGPLPDVAWVWINSTAAPGGIMVPLLETGPSTGVFEGFFRVGSGSDGDARVVRGRWGDWVRAVAGGAHRRAILNIPPYVPEGDTTEVDEDDVYSRQYTYVDPNGDPVTWYVNTTGGWLSWQSGPQRLYGTPDNGDVGTFRVDLRIEDPNFGNYSRSFDVRVNNTPPTILTEDVTVAYEDAHYEVDYASADDGAGAVWFISTDAAWLGFDADTAVLQGDPDNADVGAYMVNVSVIDGNGGVDFHAFTLLVMNTPLTITTADDTSVWQDEGYLVDYDSTDDPDVSWAIATNASWLSFNGTSGVLSGLPDNWDVGDYFVNVSVSDGKGSTDHHNFTLSVLNLPPVITIGDPLTATEDTQFTAAIDFTDRGLGTVLNITTDALWLDDIGLELGGMPTDDDVGIYFVDISVTDMWGASDRRNVTLAVENVPPAIVGSPPGSVAEDALYRYDLNATDPSVAWSVEGTSWLGIDVNGTISGTPSNADVGIASVNVTATDRHGGVGIISFLLNVTNVPTSIVASPPSFVFEDTPYSAWFNCTDEPVTWSLSTDAPWLSLEQTYVPSWGRTTARLTGTPGNGDVGFWAVTVTADDSHGGTASVDFDVDVLNVPPAILATPPKRVLEDAAYAFDLVSSDDPDVTWSLQTLADWLSVNATGWLSGTASNRHVGIWQVSIIADDGNGGLAWLNASVFVVNTPPAILNLPPSSATEREPFSFDMLSSDDGEISWQLTGPAWLSIDDSTGAISGIPLNDDVSPYAFNVTIALLDGNNGTDTRRSGIQVFNAPPAILTEPAAEVVERHPYGFELVSTDDGAYETWTVRTNASWLSFEPETASVHGTPSPADLGSYYVNCSVSDGFGGSAVINFTLSVLNGPPSILVPYIPPVAEDEPFAVQVTVEWDEPIASWEFQADAGWLNFNTTSRRLVGTPINADVGLWHASIAGTDEGGLTGVLNVTLLVENRPPAISPLLPPLRIVEGSFYRVDFNSTDSPGSWNFSGPSWLTLDPANGILWGTPGDPDFGSHWIEVTVQDGNGGSASLPFVLYVQNVNDPPRIEGEETVVANCTEPYVVDFTGIDPDGDLLGWEMTTDAVFLHLSSTGTLSGVPTNDQAGTYAVSIVVADPEGLSDRRNFTVTFLYKDLPPVLSLGTVSPFDGDERTTLTFSVWYTDPEGKPPAYVTVHILGKAFDMVLDHGVAADGKYVYTTRLGSGTYAFHFEAGDGLHPARYQAGTPGPDDPRMLDVARHDDIGWLVFLDTVLIALLVMLLAIALLYLVAPERVRGAVLRLFRRKKGVQAAAVAPPPPAYGRKTTSSETASPRRPARPRAPGRASGPAEGGVKPTAGRPEKGTKPPRRRPPASGKGRSAGPPTRPTGSTAGQPPAPVRRVRVR